MEGIELVFNGFNFAPILSAYRVNYETNYRKVITALSGKEYLGNVTRRPLIAFLLRPMTDTQSKQCYDALKVMVASCIYTDIATNTSRVAEMRVTSNLESVFVLRAADNSRYYESGEITLRGVECLA